MRYFECGKHETRLWSRKRHAAEMRCAWFFFQNPTQSENTLNAACWFYVRILDLWKIHKTYAMVRSKLATEFRYPRFFQHEFCIHNSQTLIKTARRYRVSAMIACYDFQLELFYMEMPFFSTKWIKLSYEWNKSISYPILPNTFFFI